jgi:hypothetical protein
MENLDLNSPPKRIEITAIRIPCPKCKKTLNVTEKRGEVVPCSCGNLTYQPYTIEEVENAPIQYDGALTRELTIRPDTIDPEFLDLYSSEEQKDGD